MSLDILNPGFVNVFPDQGILEIPGSNSGDQCDGLALGIGGVSMQFLIGCHQLAKDTPVGGKQVFVFNGDES